MDNRQSEPVQEATGQGAGGILLLPLAVALTWFLTFMSDSEGLFHLALLLTPVVALVFPIVVVRQSKGPLALAVAMGLIFAGMAVAVELSFINAISNH